MTIDKTRSKETNSERQLLTKVLHFALGVSLEVAGLLGAVDRNSRLDLAKAFNVHHMVLNFLTLVDYSVRFGLRPHCASLFAF